VVEDYEFNQQLFAAALNKYGHHVDIAANGAEALARWQQTGYDMILMDVQMPVMDGIEALRRIREKEKIRGGHIPIIALTASAAEEVRTDLIKKGFDGYVSKPMKIKALLSEISRCLPGKGH